jgi:hypothetical protein
LYLLNHPNLKGNFNMKNLTKKNFLSSATSASRPATFGSLSSPKKLAFQRYAKQESKPLTSDAILRCYAYHKEKVYGKTKQEFIEANTHKGKPTLPKPDSSSSSKGSSSSFPSYVEGEGKPSSSSFPSYVEGEVPLVLHELYSTDKINSGWVNENGLIVANLKIFAWTDEEARRAKLSDEELNDPDLWQEIVIGTYEWEYMKPKGGKATDLSNPENYLFTYTLELEIVENNPTSGKAEYYHIEIK